MSKHSFSRRQLFGAATATMATQVGASLVFNSSLGSSALAQMLRRSVDTGTALAAPVIVPKDRPVAVVFASAKLDFHYLVTPDNPGVGVVGNPDYAVSDVYPQFGLAKYFGDYLREIKDTHSLAIIPAGKGPGPNGGGGNHDYNAVIMEQSKTGTLAYYIGKSQGDLTGLNFGVNATADTGTAIIAEGGTQLISYNSVKTAADAITGAIDPLKPLPAAADKVAKGFNNLVTKDAAFGQKLGELGELLSGTIAPLQSAKASANATPAALGQNDYMNADLVRAHNPLLLQLAVARPLFDNGLTTSATFCIGNSDVNGGGNFLAAGGNNTDRNGYSAIAAKSMIGQFIAEFIKMYPKGVVVVAGEGGRSANGGDLNVAGCMIVGPNDRMNSFFLGQSTYALAANFGQAISAEMSNGTRMNPTIANVFATAAQVAGYDYGPHLVIKGIVKA